MTERSKRQLTFDQAQSELDLRMVDEYTYSLPSVLLKLSTTGLEVSLSGEGSSSIPQDTLVTNSPFEYDVDGMKYFFLQKDCKLVIEAIE